MTMLKAAPGCCEEASRWSRETYIPCNRPAYHHVAFVALGEGPYRMCEACAEHNLSNRGAELVAPDWKPPHAPL